MDSSTETGLQEKPSWSPLVLLTIVLATLLLMGASVVVVLDQPFAANRDRTRRLGGALVAGSAVLLLGALIWAVSQWL
jgi:hypothetical protein